MGVRVCVCIQVRIAGRCEDRRRMSVLSSEAVILRTWPVREADLIVSFQLPF